MTGYWLVGFAVQFVDINEVDEAFVIVGVAVVEFFQLAFGIRVLF